MNTRRHTISAVGIWMALMASSVAQLELKRLPVKPVEPAEPEAPKNAAPVLQQRIVIGGGGQVIINGGMVQVNGVNVVIGANGLVTVDELLQTKVEPDPAGPQVLAYLDGQRLHGTLTKLDPVAGEVLWQRTDTPAPLSIPFAQIGRWVREEQPAGNVTANATVKFTGSDWLAGNVVAIEGNEVHLQLPDSSILKTPREKIEWIHFSKSGAVETYDGPTSLAGWVSGGNWTYRDGALRATSPSPISRSFQSLPDKVEYRLLVNQGEAFNAFTVSLHARTAQLQGLTRNMIQLMLRANSLNVWGPVDGAFKSVQVDLSKVLGDAASRPKEPMLFQVFEDYVEGKLIVMINKRKAGEWTTENGLTGRNGGTFQFQPTSWSGENEQSISMIRVLPWDGRPPDQNSDEKARDTVALSSGEVKQGRVTGWDGKMLKITTESGAAEVPAEQVGLLRFQRGANPPPEAAAPVAHVRLAGRGEFDVARLEWRDGKFDLGTNFGGVMSLPPSALAEVEFNRVVPNQSLTAEHLLVFRNGDRLRGTLETVGDDGKIRWRTSPAGPASEFAPTNVAGLQLNPDSGGEAGKSVVRFRNGDWLGGEFMTLDGQQVVLNMAQAGQINAPRKAVKAVFFGGAGAPAVSDGVSDHVTWERGMDMSTGSITSTRKKPAEAGSQWSYFAGTYSRSRSMNSDITYSRSGSVQLGRLFENMASRVEVSFTVSTEQMYPLYFSAQLFTEPANSGYMMHLSTGTLSVYDMNPRARMQGRGLVQQQFPFPKEVNPNARERKIRLFADRPSGRMTIMVDGVVTGQINPKMTDGARNLGRGIMIVPQPNMGFKISDLWVGPWNGVLPGKGQENGPETVALANGDEVQGTVNSATKDTVNVTSDVGALKLPIERLTMIDFGGAPIERPNATRVHLAGQGALTVSAWRIEGETVICKSEVLGELKLPVKTVQEIVFATPPAAAGPAGPPLPAPGVPLELPLLRK